VTQGIGSVTSSGSPAWWSGVVFDLMSKNEESRDVGERWEGPAVPCVRLWGGESGDWFPMEPPSLI